MRSVSYSTLFIAHAVVGILALTVPAGAGSTSVNVDTTIATEIVLLPICSRAFWFPVRVRFVMTRRGGPRRARLLTAAQNVAQY